MKYKCCYANDREGTDLSLVEENVEASTPEEAAWKFENDNVNEAIQIRPFIYVQWGGFLEKGPKDCQIFESQKWQREEEEKQKNNEVENFSHLSLTPKGNNYIELPGALIKSKKKIDKNVFFSGVESI